MATERRRAARLLSRGSKALEERNLDRAQRDLEEAVRLDPELQAAWFDLGLVHKFRHEWQASLDCNLRSTAIGSEEGDPAWWNAGIAATALRDWPTARRAWREFGVELPDGAGPIEADLGPCPVRINPRTSGEVVWGRRVDPARIVILNIPFPESGHRWGDYVLHDGVPVGEREWQGSTYPVFEELERWQPSEIATIQCTITLVGEDDVAELVDALSAAGFAGEDWTANVRLLCKACSEGRPHEHDHERFVDGTERHFAIAADLGTAEAVLDRWVAARPGRGYRGLEAHD